jgi:hypothetical protein
MVGRTTPAARRLGLGSRGRPRELAGTPVGRGGRQSAGGRRCAKGAGPRKKFGPVVQFLAKWRNNRLRCGGVSARIYL